MISMCLNCLTSWDRPDGSPFLTCSNCRKPLPVERKRKPIRYNRVGSRGEGPKDQSPSQEDAVRRMEDRTE